MVPMALTEVNRGVCTIGRLASGGQGVILLGTCFAIRNGLFVTAAHVVSDNQIGLVICQSRSTPNLYQYQDVSDRTISTMNATIMSFDPVRDICVLKVNQVFDIMTDISHSDSLRIGDELFLLGYPHCTQSRQVLTYQTTTLGAKVLIETAGIKVKNIILNIQARPGQSGSPIFNRRTFQLVAILIGAWVPYRSQQLIFGTFEDGVDPESLHQTTHAVSSEYLLNML